MAPYTADRETNAPAAKPGCPALTSRSEELARSSVTAGSNVSKLLHSLGAGRLSRSMLGDVGCFLSRQIGVRYGFWLGAVVTRLNLGLGGDALPCFAALSRQKQSDLS